MSNIRIALFDHLYKTKDWSLSGLQAIGQIHLDDWLGKGNVRLEVDRPQDRVLVYTLWRQYGPWYEDPKRFSDCNETINSWDMNIFLGDGYPEAEIGIERHPESQVCIQMKLWRKLVGEMGHVALLGE